MPSTAPAKLAWSLESICQICQLQLVKFVNLSDLASVRSKTKPWDIFEYSQGVPQVFRGVPDASRGVLDVSVRFPQFFA